MEEYSSRLKSTSFLYLEMKKASQLHFEGLSSEEIKQKSLGENIFMMNSHNRMREVAVTVTGRIEALDDFLLDKLINGPLESSKLINLIAIIKTDRLFLEFMQEVFREKLALRDNELSDKDFSVFFHRKAEQSDKVASWKDYTYYKLKQVYKRILTEAGIARKSGKSVEVMRPLLAEDVIDHLKRTGEQVYLRALVGEI